MFAVKYLKHTFGSTQRGSCCRCKCLLCDYFTPCYIRIYERTWILSWIIPSRMVSTFSAHSFWALSPPTYDCLFHYLGLLQKREKGPSFIEFYNQICNRCNSLQRHDGRNWSRLYGICLETCYDEAHAKLFNFVTHILTHRTRQL